MGRTRHDEGFSLLEVMFAAFIAFFVLTALFGVLVTSTREGRSANVQTLATNLGNRVIEEARALPYTAVGATDAVSPDPVGVLSSHETTVFQNVTFTISRDVSWIDDAATSEQTQDYKYLQIVVAWNGGSLPFETYIRDRSSELPVPPIVEWVTTQTVLARSVLFNDQDNDHRMRIWAGDPTRPDDHTPLPGGAEYASVQAWASVNATIGLLISMQMTVDNRIFYYDEPFAPSYVSKGALHGDPDASADSVYFINTFDMETSSTTPFFTEGDHVLKVVVFSNSFAQDYRTLYVTIDNTSASFPTGAIATAMRGEVNRHRHNSELDLTWTAPLDGLQATEYYDVLTYLNGSSVASTTSWVNMGSSGSYHLAAGAPIGLTLQPFNAYRFSLVPRSKRGLSGTPSEIPSAWTLTNPRLTGTMFNAATKKPLPPIYQVTLTITPPPAAALTAIGGDSVVYDVYEKSYSAAAGGYTYPGSGDIPGTIVAADAAGPTFTIGNPGLDKYYQVEAKIRNSSGVVIATVRSNAIGYISSAASPPEYMKPPVFQTTAAIPVPGVTY